jgi:hypothetical protein
VPRHLRQQRDRHAAAMQPLLPHKVPRGVGTLGAPVATQVGSVRLPAVQATHVGPVSDYTTSLLPRWGGGGGGGFLGGAWADSSTNPDETSAPRRRTLSAILIRSSFRLSRLSRSSRLSASSSSEMGIVMVALDGSSREITRDLAGDLACEVCEDILQQVALDPPALIHSSSSSSASSPSPSSSRSLGESAWV